VVLYQRIAAALAVSVVGVALLVGGTAAGSSSVKIDARVLRDTPNGKQASFVIRLEDQADLSAANAIRDQDTRGWYVYRTLSRHAARTQAPIRALLESRHVSYEPRWAANVIVVRDRSLVEALAARPEVSVIEWNDLVAIGLKAAEKDAAKAWRARTEAGERCPGPPASAVSD
jgi:hypothetical protein